LTCAEHMAQHQQFPPPMTPHRRSASEDISDAPPLPAPLHRSHKKQLSTAFEGNGPAPVVPPRPPPRSRRHTTIHARTKPRAPPPLPRQPPLPCGELITKRRCSVPASKVQVLDGVVPPAPPPSALQQGVLGWTMREVLVWVALQAISDSAKEAFLDSGWDGDMLWHALPSELEEDLQITSSADRSELLRQIDILHSAKSRKQMSPRQSCLHSSPF